MSVMSINSIGPAWMTTTSIDRHSGGTRSASADSLKAALLSDVILPTRENAEKLSTELAADLKSLFQKAGIPTSPAVEVSVDLSDGHIRVSGNRSDKQQIEDLINKNPDLAEQIRTTSAIWSHVPAIERSLQFEKDYLASSDPKAVVAKYSGLFGSQASSSCFLRFAGSEVQAVVDGVVQVYA